MKDRVCIFIFRRDFRIEDNMALMKLLQVKKGVDVLPIFIFRPDQIDPKRNSYFNKHSVEFMIECLEDLNVSLDGKLRYFFGDDIEVLDQLLTKCSIEAIAYNRDYTPFAQQRDAALEKWCLEKGIDVVTADDYTLFPLDKLTTMTGKVYEVYTPFYKRCISLSKEIPVPQKLGKLPLYAKVIRSTVKDIRAFYGNEKSSHRTLHGGRSIATDILHKIRTKAFKDYDKERDFPAKDKTTKLSPYMKFGCLSVRETFWESVNAYGLHHGLVRELIWREFCAYVVYHHPYILHGEPLRRKYAAMKWPFRQDWFEAWCTGATGFPIVDAAMRCMNQTGFMHNRLRMVVAMFLTKDMMMHWHFGEKYFAQQLVDYDPSSNVCGWQWCASVGADAQPYFRIFNPWTQGKRFDSHAEFIYKWVPELRGVPPEAIHQWDKTHQKYSQVKYPAPMLDHADQAKKVKEFFMQYV